MYSVNINKHDIRVLFLVDTGAGNITHLWRRMGEDKASGHV